MLLPEDTAQGVCFAGPQGRWHSFAHEAEGLRLGLENEGWQYSKAGGQHPGGHGWRGVHATFWVGDRYEEGTRPQTQREASTPLATTTD